MNKEVIIVTLIGVVISLGVFFYLMGEDRDVKTCPVCGADLDFGKCPNCHK